MTLTLPSFAIGFVLGVLVTLICTRLRRRCRAAKARRRLTQYLTPRLLTENARRDMAVHAPSALPDSFWQGHN